ncbi:MAG: GNAT family N-acetyltransferase [bacterium]|nr:GNAT family N-acetyltransferase [bacterium]
MTNEIAVRESTYPVAVRQLPMEVLQDGPYEVSFARDDEELDLALRLRFAVFNEELGEGLESSYETGRDFDVFDTCCHHLVVRDTRTSEVVGTYRMQTAGMAARYRGFYSSGLFDLGSLPDEVVRSSVEVGRACVAKSHRSKLVLFLLWKSLALYVAHNQARFLFGCCSLTSQDPREGWRAMNFLERGNHMHPVLSVAPLADHALAGGPSPGDRDKDSPEVELPILFKTYLRFGSKVCGPPAIDREFKTIDYLVMMDIDGLRPRVHKLFFG